MTGIAGVLEWRRYVATRDERCVASMLSTMGYRGREGSRIQLNPGCALGALTLSAPSDQRSQPFQLANHWVVADARLDDRARLAKLLEVSGAVSDSELILRAYLKWGHDCVEYLLGDFAFVVITPDSVFCARDHLGVKPFYFSEHNGSFWFASEARPIAWVIDAPMSEIRIADSLAYPLEHVDTTSTFYEGVFRLPAASMMTVDRIGSTTTRYWNPTVHPADSDLSEQSCLESFSQQLEVAVADRLNESGPTAMGLSGGVDSSTLVGFAISMGKAVQTFSTVCAQDSPCVESSFVRRAVKDMQLDAVLIDSDVISNGIDTIFSQLGGLQEPFDYAMVQMMALFQSAAARGHRSIIDGVEGDMIYSLPSNYPAQLYRGGALLQGIREAVLAAKRRGHVSYPKALWTSIRQLGAPRLMARLKREFAGNSYEADLAEALISIPFSQKTGTLERLEQQQIDLQTGRETIEKSHLREVLHPVLPAAMERYDRVAALSGIETRHPLMDKRLVELSLSFPAEMKVKDGWTKFMLRKAGKGRVPTSISWRTDKSENAWIVYDQLEKRKGGILREFVADSRKTLAPFVKTEKLVSNAIEDVIPLYVLAKWLQVESDHTTG